MYAFLKVVHLLAVMSWMAGLFYLPRLFVYHADQKPESDTAKTFLVMERRLLKAIMRPAAAVALVSGLWLLHVLSIDMWETWVIVKLAAVVLMVAFHGLLEKHAGEFRMGGAGRSGRYFRVINEVPTVLLIVIVVMVVVRPFSS